MDDVEESDPPEMALAELRAEYGRTLEEYSEFLVFVGEAVGLDGMSHPDQIKARFAQIISERDVATQQVDEYLAEVRRLSDIIIAIDELGPSTEIVTEGLRHQIPWNDQPMPIETLNTMRLFATSEHDAPPQMTRRAVQEIDRLRAAVGIARADRRDEIMKVLRLRRALSAAGVNDEMMINIELGTP